MSHYLALVVGKDYNKELSPFCEDIEYLDEEYIVFSDETEEVKQNYENGSYMSYMTYNDIRLSRRKFRKLKQNKTIKIEISNKKIQGISNDCKIEIISNFNKNKSFCIISSIKKINSKSYLTLKLISRPIKIFNREKYSNIYEFAEANNYEINDDMRIGYRYNPNAEYDWYVLGGRWAGELLAKKITKQNYRGSRSWYNNNIKYNKKEFDSLIKENVDIKKMLKKHIKELSKQYELMKKEKKINISLKQYIKENFSLCFSILKNGKWSKNGNMGWFGIVTNKDENWFNNFFRVWNSIDNKERISIIDCHI